MTKKTKFFLSLLLIVTFSIQSCALFQKYRALGFLENTRIKWSAIHFRSFTPEKKLLHYLSKEASPWEIALWIKDLSSGKLKDDLGVIVADVTLLAHNTGEEAYQIDSVALSLHLDTLVSIPLKLKKSILLPAAKTSPMNLELSLDANPRLYPLPELKEVRLSGELWVRIPGYDKQVPFAVDIKHPLSHQENVQWQDQIRKEILRFVSENFMKNIF
jgi:hypothetical protein